MKKQTMCRIGMGYGLKKRKIFMLLQHNSLLYLRGIYLMKIFIYLKNDTIKQKILAFKLRSQLN